MRKHNSVIFAALLAIATPGLTAPVWAQEAPAKTTAQTNAQIAVTGEGVVMAAPDMATISLGVTQTAATAKAAMDQTNAELGKVLANLKAAGIAGRDLQTSGVSLQPQRSSSSSSSDIEVKGYTARNQLTVIVRKIDTLGTILDAAVKDGANTLDNVQFGVADPAPLLDEARLRAVADARHRAEVITGAAGVRLGPIAAITEGGGNMPGPRGAMFARAAADSMPVEGGELSFSVGINVTWEILQ